MFSGNLTRGTIPPEVGKVLEKVLGEFRGTIWKILEEVPGELNQRNKLRVKMSRPDKPSKLGDATGEILEGYFGNNDTNLGGMVVTIPTWMPEKLIHESPQVLSPMGLLGVQTSLQGPRKPKFLLGHSSQPRS